MVEYGRLEGMGRECRGKQWLTVGVGRYGERSGEEILSFSVFVGGVLFIFCFWGMCIVSRKEGLMCWLGK